MFLICRPIYIYRKYKLGVIIDLHAAPGSQNTWEHSSSRDGTQEWGKTDDSIAQTVQVIDFLASRSGHKMFNHSRTHVVAIHVRAEDHFSLN
jgi:aryl-phospho-beta-D-glucosidase BglC (GH1 family)